MWLISESTQIQLNKRYALRCRALRHGKLSCFSTFTTQQESHSIPPNIIAFTRLYLCFYFLISQLSQYNSRAISLLFHFSYTHLPCRYESHFSNHSIDLASLQILFVRLFCIIKHGAVHRRCLNRLHIVAIFQAEKFVITGWTRYHQMLKGQH